MRDKDEKIVEKCYQIYIDTYAKQSYTTFFGSINLEKIKKPTQWAGG